MPMGNANASFQQSTSNVFASMADVQCSRAAFLCFQPAAKAHDTNLYDAK